MKKLFLVLLLLLSATALAQDAAKNAVKATPKIEEKAKPVILKKDAELRDLRLAELELQNLQLQLEKLQSSIKEMQGEIKKADDNVTAFWAKLGVQRSELSTKWEVSQGQGGDIILTRKAEAPKVEEKPKQ